MKPRQRKSFVKSMREENPFGNMTLTVKQYMYLSGITRINTIEARLRRGFLGWSRKDLLYYSEYDKPNVRRRIMPEGMVSTWLMHDKGRDWHGRKAYLAGVEGNLI